MNLNTPWSRDKEEFADWGWIRDCNGHMVAVASVPENADILKHRRDKTDPTDEVSDLIAAAPDLLEALESIMKEVVWMSGSWWPEASEKAKAAISKAKGN